jgi:hypothetical protein
MNDDSCERTHLHPKDNVEKTVSVEISHRGARFAASQLRERTERGEGRGIGSCRR